MYCNSIGKRVFDVFVSFSALFILFPFLLCIFIICSLNTMSFGLFFQKRVGRLGSEFQLIKFKSMRSPNGSNPYNTETVAGDPRITFSGRFFRKFKIDELPQLFNVLIGDMSIVGPRPDVPSVKNLYVKYNGMLTMSVRPGLTGPASIIFRNEEFSSLRNSDIRKYSERNFRWKIYLNKRYIKNSSFVIDVLYIIKTFCCLFNLK